MNRDECATPRNEVLYLAFGLADVMLAGARGVLRRLPGRADVTQELRARGELAWGRTAPAAQAHMEVLARRVNEREAQVTPHVDG